MSDYRKFGPGDEVEQDDGDTKFTGVNNRLAPDKLGPGILADGENLRMRTGEPETRLGVVKPAWLNATRPGVDSTINPVGDFYGVGNFKDPNGEEWVLECSDGNIYRCKPGNCRESLPLPTGVRLLSRCVPVPAFDQVFLFRGKYLQPLVMASIDAGFLDVEPRWSASTVYKAAVLATGQVAQEMAYGPFIAVSSLTSVGGTATVVTTNEHGYVTGADVVITGAATAAYNGRFNITVLDVNTFTYQFEGGTSPDAGTVKCSNMAYYWQALGSMATVSSLTRSGTTATLTTTGSHGFTSGQYVTVAGATPAAYNGTWLITVTGANTFTYALPADPGSNASGVITCRTSVVLAGQSPDTNPEAWEQLYDVLPNADDALFINNQLLVPTAYTPGAVNYDSTSVYTKKDFIVAMNIGDLVHFQFTNAFRINQGSADEIVNLVKYNQNTALVIKGASWGILSNVGGDLSQVTLDMHGDQYGSCALSAAIVAGKNVMFPATKRGICSLQQNELGQTRSVDIPFSNDFEAVVGRINWTYASKIRLAWWDDKLYVAVPLDSAMVPATGPNVSPTAVGPFFYYTVSGLVVGQRYQYIPGDSYELTTGVTISGGVPQFPSPSGTVIAPGWFTATQTTYYLWPPNISIASTTGTVRGLVGVNNAILVYDFRAGTSGATWTFDFQSGQWQGYDTGTALTVKEFFTANYNGKLRLFFIAEDGYANLMEEAPGQDQVFGTGPQALAWEDIQTSGLTRGYLAGSSWLKQFKATILSLGVWNAVVSISAMLGTVASEKVYRSGLSFSRTKYLKPAGKPDYVEGNANGDFLTPGRGDYSVRLLPGGVTPGYSLGQFQEVLVKTSLRPLSGRYVQFRFSSTQGRLRLKSVGPEASEGIRRSGVLV